MVDQFNSGANDGAGFGSNSGSFNSGVDPISGVGYGVNGSLDRNLSGSVSSPYAPPGASPDVSSHVQSPVQTSGLSHYTNGLGRNVVHSVSGLGNQIIDRLKFIPQAGTSIAGRVDRHARANPWMHIGIAGAGFLALGWLLGRRFTNNVETIQSVAVIERYEDIDF
jgi:hypothetical protein